MSIVKSIRIQNFKSLEDVTIDLSQLTLLFGANSSGKSSFLKALMFLAKNLFPLQYPKSKYQIGNDIDLESLEKIVTNGDVNKNLEYEFELSGSVCFPERRIIFDRLPQFEGRYDFFRRLESLQNKNVRGGSESHNFEVVYTIVFSNFLYEIDPESKEIITEKDKCICRVIIFDKISQMKYEFVLGNLTDSGDIEDYETYYHIQKPYIKDVFASKIGFVKKRKDYSKYSHFVNQRKSLFTGIDLDDIHSDEFNRSGNGEILSTEWESLSHEDRVENFIEFMKFFYLTVRVIPTALEQFLSVIHMPTTRESVKRFYELHNDTIDENEYYGFLPSLLRYSQENLSQGVMSYCKRNEDFQKTLDQDFIRIIREADKDRECIVDVNGIKMRVVSGFLFNDLCLLVNYWLLKFDCDLYFSTYKDSKICEFYLTDCKELQISFKQASSGLIQLFPIIVSCCILLRI